MLGQRAGGCWANRRWRPGCPKVCQDTSGKKTQKEPFTAPKNRSSCLPFVSSFVCELVVGFGASCVCWLVLSESCRLLAATKLTRQLVMKSERVSTCRTDLVAAEKINNNQPSIQFHFKISIIQKTTPKRSKNSERRK